MVHVGMVIQDAYSGLVGTITEIRPDGGLELESYDMPWHLSSWERFTILPVSN